MRYNKEKKILQQMFIRLDLRLTPFSGHNQHYWLPDGRLLINL